MKTQSTLVLQDFGGAVLGHAVKKTAAAETLTQGLWSAYWWLRMY